MRAHLVDGTTGVLGRTSIRGHIVVFVVLCCMATAASAEETVGTNDVTQANNPLAAFTAFSLHNYYIGELTSPDKDADQFWARFAKPFSLGDTNWIMRASLPINTFPEPPEQNSQTGIGDLNVFAPYLIDTGIPTLAFGLGPQITAPTASKSASGSGKWSAGFVNTLFDFASPTFQYGYLLSWQESFAGSSSRKKVDLVALQPFAFYQLGGGTYLRSTGIMVYDFESRGYSVPIGLGIGKVVPRGKVVFNAFIEPQVSIADKGSGWPKWQIFVGLNSQFK